MLVHNQSSIKLDKMRIYVIALQAQTQLSTIRSCCDNEETDALKGEI